jgi:hypothetical protein
MRITGGLSGAFLALGIAVGFVAALRNGSITLRKEDSFSLDAAFGRLHGIRW